MAADDRRRRDRRGVPADRRPGQPDRHHHGPGPRGAPGRGDDLRRHRGRLDRGRRRTHPRGRHVARSHRMQRRGVLRGSVDSVAGRDRRGQRAPGVGTAPVPHHHAIRPAGAARPADVARPRSADVLQGRGRRSRDGRIRTEPDPMGQRRHSQRLQLQTARQRLRSLRTDHGTGDGTRARIADSRHQRADQRPRELHPRRQLHTRRGTRAKELLRRRRLQRVRHRCRRWRRHGSG